MEIPGDTELTHFMPYQEGGDTPTATNPPTGFSSGRVFLGEDSPSDAAPPAATHASSDVSDPVALQRGRPIPSRGMNRCDNIRVQAIPEPGAAGLPAIGEATIGVIRLLRRPRTALA